MSSEVQFTLHLRYDNASTYLTTTGDGYAPFTGSTGKSEYAFGVFGYRVSGDIILNDAAKAVLYPNSTAHPTGIYGAYNVNVAVSNTNNTYLNFQIDGTNVATCDGKFSKTSTRTVNIILNDSNRSAVLGSTRSSTLHFPGYAYVGLGVNNAIASSSALIYLYFNQYDFTATAGSNVSSASVSSSTGYDGDTIQYRCVLASGATWQGWYLNGSLYSATKDLDITVNGTDLALEARATMPTTKTLSATYDGSQLSGFPKSVSSDVALTYNGTSKGSVPFSGGTKTFQCANKLASGNITIGSATLQCANKLMKSNVVVSIS